MQIELAKFNSKISLKLADMTFALAILIRKRYNFRVVRGKRNGDQKSVINSVVGVKEGQITDKLLYFLQMNFSQVEVTLLMLRLNLANLAKISFMFAKVSPSFAKFTSTRDKLMCKEVLQVIIKSYIRKDLTRVILLGAVGIIWGRTIDNIIDYVYCVTSGHTIAFPHVKSSCTLCAVNDGLISSYLFYIQVLYDDYIA